MDNRKNILLFNKSKPLIPIPDNELYRAEDAADIYREKDNTSGFTPQVANIQSLTTDSYNGNYAILLSNPLGSYVYNYVRFPVLAGRTYRISMFLKVDADTNQVLRLWQGFTTSPNTQITTTEYTEYTFDLIAAADGNADARVYLTSGGTISTNKVYIDNVSILDLG